MKHDKMKILLMNPPMKEEELFTKSSKETASRIPPLGLAYLAAYLEREGHTVKIWDGFYEKINSWNDIAKEAAEFDVLGIHTLTSFAKRSYEFAAFLKKKLPNKPVVLGGCHVSAVAIEAISMPFVDFVVVGEGEITFSELCHKIYTKQKDFENIPGLYYKRRGKPVFTGRRSLIEDLDSLPLPARHLFNWDLYKSSDARKGSIKKDLAILTSRGCPYQCSYCSKDVTGHRVRNFSIDRVITEIKQLVNDYGIEELSIWDETFTLSRKRVIEFCKALKKNKLNLTWSCSSRVNVVDLELLKIMKKHGCNFIAYGIESGNETILKTIGKGISKEMIVRAIRDTKKAKISVRGYFMIGLWGDTKETINDTIQFAKQLDLDIATFTLLVPLPNTLDYVRAEKQPGFKKEYWKKRMFPEFNFLDKPIYVPVGMTADELIRLHKKAYRQFYFRPTFFFRQIMSIHSIKDVKRLLAGAKTILKI